MKEYFKLAKSQVYLKGDQVNVKGKANYLVSGYVSLYSLDRGSKKLLFIYKDGEVFPYPYQASSLTAGQKLSYEAISTVTVLSQPATRFVDQICATPQGVEKLIKAIQNFNQLILLRIENLSYSSARFRLVERLKYFAERFGITEGGRVIIDLPITYSDIALSVGSTRETVNRLMSEFQKKGVIEVKDGAIIIKSIDKLH